MRQDTIARIEIAPDSRLHVVPSSESFPYIWREAMEVHWDESRCSLYAPPPRTWSQARWLRQILDAAQAQGCELLITAGTDWIGVEPATEAELLREVRSAEGAR